MENTGSDYDSQTTETPDCFQVQDAYETSTVDAGVAGARADST